MNAGLRVDIDCFADVLALPSLIDVLDKHDARATFFIATGKDETFRNIGHYTGQKVFDIPIRRYCRGLFHNVFKSHLESHEYLKMLLDTDHEIGLHGYRHYEWMNFLRMKSREEISLMISNGCELFEHEFGFKPRSFASPGFQTSDNYLLALDEFGFDYSSDFYGNGFFHPEINGKKLKTVQVPVSMPSPGEMGLDDNKILMRIKEQCKEKYVVLYIHPSCEAVIKKNLLEQIINLTGYTRTLSEMHENPSDL